EAKFDALSDLAQQINLFGRQPELTRLHKWIVEDNCRLVGIFGIGGQGKSALAAAVARTLAEAAPVEAEPALGFQHII
ncbi:MAG TPA: hypothetical protein P5526_18270, partial [Anaerolineae bacterium]|nr:hypothetical protein [Anaerolineae bacterium]